MKAIIFTQELAANTALSACTTSIAQGAVAHEGDGPFIDPEPGKPYTLIVKHPSQAKWALLADEQVEALLDEVAVELDATWFPPRLPGMPAGI